MKVNDTTVPGWVWRGTLTGVALIIGSTTLGAILLASGAADPPIAGSVIWSDTDLTWAGGPVKSLTSGESIWFSAPESARLPLGEFTLDVAARLAPESDPGTAWGVWIETMTGARVIYAISGEGYTTTRICEDQPPHLDTPSARTDPHPTLPHAWGRNHRRGAGVGVLEDCPALRPEWRWMPYPRLRPPGVTNTVTLHVEATDSGESEVRLRLNREIMGAAAFQWSGRWGVWLRGGRAGGASGTGKSEGDTIRFISVTLRG